MTLSRVVMKHYRISRVFAVLSVALAGCNAKFLDRVELHLDGSATEHIRFVMDDQFYNLARSSNPDDFKIPSNTQDVSLSTDGDGNHVFERTSELSADEVRSGKFTLMQGTSAKTEGLHFHSGLFTRTVDFSREVPSLQSIFHIGNGDGNAIAQLGDQMVGNSVSVRIELAAPGKLTSTSGERNPDGSYGWSLGFTEPTEISFKDEVVRPESVAATALLSLVALAALTTLILRQRRRRKGIATVTYDVPADLLTPTKVDR